MSVIATEAVQRVLDRLDCDRLQEELAARRSRGEHVGLGIACFVEKSGLGPQDLVRIKVDGRGAVAVFAPFFILGAWQSHSKESVIKARLLNRDLLRSRTLLIRNARIFTGDGRVIESGAVLVKNGKIQHVYEGSSPEPKDLKADPKENAGVLLAYQNAGLFNKLGRVWVCWGDLRTEHLPEADLRARLPK